MKRTLTTNWPAKIASLIAAYAIWYVIHQHINEGSDFKFTDDRAQDQLMLEKKLQEVYELQAKINQQMDENPPKAVPVPEEELPETVEEPKTGKP